MYTVRKSRPDDLDLLNGYLDQLNQHHHDASPEFFKTAEEISQQKDLALYIDSDWSFTFIAEVDQSPVGFIAGHVRELISPICKSITMGSIDELFISKEHRGKGVGTSLVRRLEDEVRKLGASHVFVEVWEFNQRAFQFYKKLGMQAHVHWVGKTL